MVDSKQSLEAILQKTVAVLEESKRDIFAIAESTRKEYDNLRTEITLINKDINSVIDEMEYLTGINKKARLRLMEVSRDFTKYSEEDIREAYQKAEKTSVEIAVLKEKEGQLKKRRRELEGRLLKLKENVEKAENLVSKVGVIKSYLLGELNNLSNHFNDLKQKESLAIRVIQAQEEERKRLAREIHDGPAQSIANLVFRVELTQQLLDKDIQQAKAELEEIKQLIRLGMQDIRKMIYDLRPMALDDLGLIPTLQRYVEKFERQTGILVDFRVLGSQYRLSNSYEVALFRLIQEALNNIYKHSQARHSQVRLEYSKDCMNLFISDDGIGFDPGEKREDKYGLINMQERCNLLGGKIKIESSPNKGTIIKIMIPSKRSEEGYGL